MSSDDLQMNTSYVPLMTQRTEEAAPYWNIGHSITETSFTAMAKDTRVTFDSSQTDPPANKQNHKVHCHRPADRQISYEDAENCVNEMSESFPALSTRAHRIMRQVSGSFNSRTIKVALILSVILNLLLAVPFGIFFGFWMSQRHTATAVAAGPALSVSSSPEQAPNCVLCSSLNNAEMKNRVRIRFNHATMCCLEDKSSTNDPDQLATTMKTQTILTFETANDSVEAMMTQSILTSVTTNNLAAAVKTEAKSSLPPKSLNDSATTMKVALCLTPVDMNDLYQKFKDLFPCKGGNKDAWAQFTLDVKNTKLKSHSTKEADKLFHWLNNGEIGKGIQNKNSTVRVVQSGNYYVFSHLTLSSIESPFPEDVEEKIVTHSIVKKNPFNRRSSTLLLDQLTVKRQEIRSSTNGGVVYLEEDEEIYVFVSTPFLLKDTEHANVFGLFLI